MSKKDYVLIADVLRHALNDYPEADGVSKGIRYAARRLAFAMQEANPKFDRRKFLIAAGVGA